MKSERDWNKAKKGDGVRESNSSSFSSSILFWSIFLMLCVITRLRVLGSDLQQAHDSLSALDSMTVVFCLTGEHWKPSFKVSSRMAFREVVVATGCCVSFRFYLSLSLSLCFSYINKHFQHKYQLFQRILVCFQSPWAIHTRRTTTNIESWAQAEWQREE